MLKEAVYHKVNSEYAYHLGNQKFLVKIRIKKNDCTAIDLFYVDKYKFLFSKQEFSQISMTKSYSDHLFDYFEAIIDYDVIGMGYFFKLINNTEVLYYGDYVFYDTINTKENICYLPNMFTMPVLSESDLFYVPKWAENSIVYQIFPNSFYCENLEQDPEKHKNWYKSPDNFSHFGGTLQGIIDKIDYLKNLGINTLYLNPIFEAWGNHKYCTYDYFNIDSQFGDFDTFKNLVSICHANNIKVVLDGVFSSTGLKFFAFDDVVKNGESSKYTDWFLINKFPVSPKSPDSYTGFAYMPLLPKLNFSNPEVINYFISVMLFWIIEADIDGWRLDVGDEVPHSFWIKAREAVKSIKNDTLLVGEVWYDARSWLLGNQFDSVMNYRFFSSVLEFIAHDKTTPSYFIDSLQSTLALYKKQTHKILWNLIGSHDTSRFLTECSDDISKLKLAALIQFTFIGTPVIYYGDEVGMNGLTDPDCRKAMLWDKNLQNSDLFSYYSSLIQIRKNNPELVHGDFELVAFDDPNNILIYKRSLETNELFIFINNSNQSYKLPLNGKFLDLISNTYIDSDNLVLDKKSGYILKKV